MRERGASTVVVLGACLLALSFVAPILADDPETGIAARRSALAIGGGVFFVVAFVLAGGRARRIALAAALSVAASLCVAEFVLRLTVGPYYAALYRVSDAWLFEHIPGARRINVFATKDGYERVAFDVNADGFRGPELRAPGAAKRVVVYGDSFIAARATRIEETYVADLGRELRDALGVDVEAVNAGVVGYGPDQVSLRMEAELPRLRPDLVVVAVTAENDYGDLVRDRLFELGPRGELVRRRVELTPEMRDAYARAQGGLVIEKTFATVQSRLRDAIHRSPYRSVGPVADGALAYELAQCRYEHQAAFVEHVAAPLFDGPDHPDADVRLEPSSESSRSKIRLMAGVLSAARDAAQKGGVPMLLLVIPSAGDVCRNYDMDAADSTRWPAYRPDNLSRPIDEIAQALGVAYVDLFQAFRAADADALYFHGGDTHWNSAGQALAAKLTAREIVARGLAK